MEVQEVGCGNQLTPAVHFHKTEPIEGLDGLGHEDWCANEDEANSFSIGKWCDRLNLYFGEGQVWTLEPGNSGIRTRAGLFCRRR